MYRVYRAAAWQRVNQILYNSTSKYTLQYSHYKEILVDLGRDGRIN
jgi:hypothetical protein